MPDTKQHKEKRPVCRPPEIGGRRVQVYLDVKSREIAAKLGNGNVSDGIRKAIAAAQHKT